MNLCGMTCIQETKKIHLFALRQERLPKDKRIS